MPRRDNLVSPETLLKHSVFLDRGRVRRAAGARLRLQADAGVIFSLLRKYVQNQTFVSELMNKNQRCFFAKEEKLLQRGSSLPPLVMCRHLRPRCADVQMCSDRLQPAVVKRGGFEAKRLTQAGERATAEVQFAERKQKRRSALHL